MNGQELRILQSFRRVQGWFAAHPEVIPASSGGAAQTPALATQVDALNGVVSRLSDDASDQKVQSLQSTLLSKDEIALRKDVFAHIRGFTKVAQALRGTVPGIGVLKVPDSNMQSESLVGAVNVLSKNAAIYQDVLVEHGVPQDFLKQLEDASTTLRRSIDARGEARSRRAGATKGIGEDLKLGRRIVALMDASVERVLRTEPAKLAEWRHAKRATVRGPSGRPAVADVTPTSVPSVKAG